jgi:peptide-methionine (S)-S-oxide reductase
MARKLLVVAAVFFFSVVSDDLKAQQARIATFAGGCFWCVESDFDKVPGVVETISGYTGGSLPNPTYEQVSAGGSGHREAVQVAYDPSVISYADLLTVFWHSVDPTDADGQFCDQGESYRTAIFIGDDDERRLAEASKRAAEQALGREVATSIEAAGPFFPAEGYHQDYYRKNPLRYQYYRWSCGRNQRIKELWGERAFEGIPNHE